MSDKRNNLKELMALNLLVQRCIRTCTFVLTAKFQRSKHILAARFSSLLLTPENNAGNFSCVAFDSRICI